MSDPKPLVIKDFQKGIAPSPYLGFADMRNLDISTYPGIVRLNNLPVKKSGSTVTDLVQWIIQNPRNSDVWALGDTARVYKSTDGGDNWSLVTGNSSGNGQGIAIWKDYLFVARTSHIETYGPLSSSPSWTTTWKSIDSDSVFHPMIVGQDDILYGGAGRYVFSLEETPGDTFDPSDSASYTFNSRALDLPAEYRIKCLAELGEKLMIGTYMNSGFDTLSADIFPWDRTSDSVELPLRLNDNGVNAMININNLLYIFPGTEGRVLVTNGTSTTEIAKIPNHIVNLDGGKFLRVFPGGVTQDQGRILFGIGSNSSTGGLGVWSLKPSLHGNILTLENTISTGNSGAVDDLKVGALLATSKNSYLIGWEDGTTYGIDKIDNSKRCTSYTGYFESPLFQVGTSWHPRKFSKVMFELNRPLISSQGVKISFRTSLADSYTLIDTFDFSTYAGIKTFEKTYSIITEKVQFKVQLTSPGTNNNSPELMSVVAI